MPFENKPKKSKKKRTKLRDLWPCVDVLIAASVEQSTMRRGATYPLHRHPRQNRLVRHLMYTILQLLQKSQRPMRDTEIIATLATRFGRTDPDFQRQVHLNLQDAVSYGILKRQSHVFTLRSKRFTEIVDHLPKPRNVWIARWRVARYNFDKQMCVIDCASKIDLTVQYLVVFSWMGKLSISYRKTSTKYIVFQCYRLCSEQSNCRKRTITCLRIYTNI